MRRFDDIEQPPVSAVEVDRMALYLRQLQGQVYALERGDIETARRHRLACARLEFEAVAGVSRPPVDRN